jgi:cbb3-type cytochrome oxidase maturation protein
MTVIVALLGLSLMLGGTALAIFLWALRRGQFDDLDGAAQRILFDEDVRS